ncbi:MAG: hypothetical protein J0I20_05180 [Chloroflexi bacterium]|nr:hypothetical protein [Chloroflexota bacterium]OJV97764.1 MAG: hypothetical protein BGO39_07525 [Chloroflexi bacterium 54-19]
MTSTSSISGKETPNQRLSRLKTQQQLCNKLLMDCVSLMEVYPDYTERLMAVMNQVESMMEQNSRLIARIENPA